MNPVVSQSSIEVNTKSSSLVSRESNNNDVVRVEFQIEDLVSRLALPASSDVDAFTSCSGCSSCSA